MQPYFLPYAGYFRLFAAADLFVVYDCVQFPRRGYVHRNQLLDRSGALTWLTLPLTPAPVSTRIEALTFAPDGQDRWSRQLARFAAPGALPAAERVFEAMSRLERRPVDYILALLELCCDLLDCRRPMLRSSAMGLPDDLRGQERILEIAARVGAARYVNAPGGVGLYDPAAFEDRGLKLAFLTPYEGPKPSILQRLRDQPIETLRREFQAPASLILT